jgi:hypothetical protein
MGIECLGSIPMKREILGMLMFLAIGKLIPLFLFRVGPYICLINGVLEGNEGK